MNNNIEIQQTREYKIGYHSAMEEVRHIVEVLMREQDKTELGIAIAGTLNKVSNRVKALEVEQG
jgi:hypothetical protein